MSERRHAVFINVRGQVHESLLEECDRAGVSIRHFILNALKNAGVDISSEDLRQRSYKKSSITLRNEIISILENQFSELGLVIDQIQHALAYIGSDIERHNLNYHLRVLCASGRLVKIGMTWVINREFQEK